MCITMNPSIKSRNKHIYYLQKFFFFWLILTGVCFFLWIFREIGGGETDTSMLVALCPVQPRYVPFIRIKLGALQYAGRHSIPWARLARALSSFLNLSCPALCFCLTISHHHYSIPWKPTTLLSVLIHWFALKFYRNWIF